MKYPERNDDTLRLAALTELAGKYSDSQVILVNRKTGHKQCIVAAAFVDGMIMLSVHDEGLITAPGTIVSHVTKRGKTITGTIHADLDRNAAMAIDPYTFRKDGGWFIRCTATTATGPAADATRSLIQVLTADA